MSVDHFQAMITSDPSTVYARTGYLGFIKKSDKTAPDRSEWSDHYYCCLTILIIPQCKVYITPTSIKVVAGIVVVVDPGTIPINSRGEKQRMHLRDSFLADELDPIYVSYNL